MANYGPPGGSPEPWGGRRPDDRWGPPGPDEPAPPGVPPRQQSGPVAHPADRYPPDPYRPVDQPPAAAPEGYGPTEPYTPGTPGAYPGDPTSGRGRGALVAVLVVLAVLVVGGGTLWYLRDSGDGSPTRTDAVLPTSPVEPDTATTGPAATTPALASSADPRFVKTGQCVRNEGVVAGKPKLMITECVPKTYEVLRRFDGATSGERDAEAKCGKVEGYTNWYFFDSELDTLDFVLCLKQR
ncbi:flagellar basal body protein FliL [Micromonospora sp. WMMD714]|nr:flagellar basal body protein FliL [Micromonospora sp. WMMD714]WFE63081.1 flagellar basal body protein FliL [Micromonospora sp. WMMD714]